MQKQTLLDHSQWPIFINTHNSRFLNAEFQINLSRDQSYLTLLVECDRLKKIQTTQDFLRETSTIELCKRTV